jgi:hypothetical protein
MATLIQYKLDSILSFHEKHEYILTEEQAKIIAHLDNLIVDDPIQSIPLTRSDRSFDKNHRHRNRKQRGVNRGYPSSNDMDNWEAIRDFKPTEKIEVLGLDKEINELRSYLNKISKNNYNTQRDLIVEKINNLFSNENMEKEHIDKVVNSVFDTCSISKFLSDLYADLYVELIGNHDVFGNKLDTFLSVFREGLTNIQYVNPDDDYDGFCKYNLINEHRKSNSLFIVNLMKRDMITQTEFLDLLIDMQKQSLEFIFHENKVHEVEEFTENIFVFVTQSKEVLGSLEMWKKIDGNIQYFTTLKTKDYPSLSNRCRFKYMDM